LEAKVDRPVPGLEGSLGERSLDRRGHGADAVKGRIQVQVRQVGEPQYGHRAAPPTAGVGQGGGLSAERGCHPVPGDGGIRGGWRKTSRTCTFEGGVFLGQTRV